MNCNLCTQIGFELAQNLVSKLREMTDIYCNNKATHSSHSRHKWQSSNYSASHILDDVWHRFYYWEKLKERKGMTSNKVDGLSYNDSRCNAETPENQVRNRSLWRKIYLWLLGVKKQQQPLDGRLSISAKQILLSKKLVIKGNKEFYVGSKWSHLVSGLTMEERSFPFSANILVSHRLYVHVWISRLSVKIVSFLIFHFPFVAKNTVTFAILYPTANSAFFWLY